MGSGRMLEEGLGKVMLGFLGLILVTRGCVAGALGIIGELCRL